MYRAVVGLAIGWFCASTAWGAEESPATAGSAEKAPPQRAPLEAALPDAGLFDRLDANHDGQLSRDEIPEDKRTLFDRLLKQADRDKSGQLSRDEFVAGLESHRPQRAADEKLPAEFGGLPSPEAMEDIFRRLDRNQDGKVAPGEVPDEGRERFDRLAAFADTDGDGSISKEEFQKGIEKIRRPFAGRSDLDPKDIFDQLDRNADGQLTLDEIPSEHLERFKRGVQFGDRDGDGALSVEEFSRVVLAHRAMQKRLESASSNDSPAAAPQDPPKNGKRARGGKENGKPAARLAKLDTDHDGKVSFAEFTAGGKNRFNRLDRNQDGFLDSNEIRQAGANRALKTGVQKSSESPEGSP